MKSKIREELYLSAFSKWIENFGVVPLLLFLAFLLCPALTFLASLLFLVTRVFETIFQLLLNLKLRGLLPMVSHQTNLPSFFKLQVLPRPISHVKVFSLVYLLIIATHTVAQITKTNNQLLNNTSLSLAKGEILSIPLGRSSHFTIANREIISVKATQAGKNLLIKAKSLGISDLIIWSGTTDKKAKHYHITVLSKKTHQRLAVHKRKLKSLGFQATVYGQNLNISGTISSKLEYQQVIEARNSLPERLKIKSLKLSQKMKSAIYSHFLEELMRRKIMNLDCKMEELLINCFESKEMKSILKDLSQDYLIKRVSNVIKNQTRQFNISLTLQQFESANGQVFSLGLDELKASWQEIIDTNPLALIKKNYIQANNSNYKSKTIARPQIIGRLNKPIKVRIGQEISFFQNNSLSGLQELRTRQWKFAGLSLDITLRAFGEDLQVEYLNTLSKPEQSIISTNSQASSIMLSPGNSQVLFNIGFQTNQEDISKFPLLSSIPLLGSLFKSNAYNNTYKKILCLINIEEI
jgi:Flp pilus assembly secretin CpaC